ncbi:MAG: fatty acid desaturase family protein [Chloroflexia bacterium]
MDLEIMRDPRVRSVQWRDLTRLNKLEVISELILPVPWLLASLYTAQQAWYPIALGLSFVFFLTGLRVVHGAYHYTLGLARVGCEWVMFVLSVLMLGSMHAVQINHLQHHKHCMDDEDVEAISARMSAWRAILVGPLFPVLLHANALKLARPRQLKWIGAELLANAAWVAWVLGPAGIPVLRYHVIAMAVGQCLTAFFAVWTVHHDCDRSHYIARTLRGRIMGLVTFDMFYHVEHHLFPQVPTCRLPQLAARLDQAAPELQEKRVIGTPDLPRPTTEMPGA